MALVGGCSRSRSWIGAATIFDNLFGFSNAYVREWGIRQELNLIKEGFLLSGAADSIVWFPECGWS